MTRLEVFQAKSVPGLKDARERAERTLIPNGWEHLHATMVVDPIAREYLMTVIYRLNEKRSS
jgi:hypothetical protein